MNILKLSFWNSWCTFHASPVVCGKSRLCVRLSQLMAMNVQNSCGTSSAQVAISATCKMSRHDGLRGWGHRDRKLHYSATVTDVKFHTLSAKRCETRCSVFRTWRSNYCNRVIRLIRGVEANRSLALPLISIKRCATSWRQKVEWNLSSSYSLCQHQMEAIWGPVPTVKIFGGRSVVFYHLKEINKQLHQN